MKNNYSKMLSQKILILLTLGISLGAQVSAHDATNYNLSQNVKENIENRLGTFLARVDTYEQSSQNNIYRNLQERINTLQTAYATNSDIYDVLEIVDLIAEHKLDEDIILTNSQILSHIIFGQDIPHYDKQDNLDQMDSSDNQNDSDMQDNGNAMDEDEEIGEYRADLDTDELNEVPKNILAGTAKGVLQLEVRADLEGVESETVEFRFNQDIEGMGLTGRLYKNGFFVGESSASGARGNTLTIDNLNNFIIETDTQYVQLELVTQTIGKEQIGRAISDLQIISTTFTNNTGVITGDEVGNSTNRQISQSINIVPADISVIVESEFERFISTSRINIFPQVGENNDNGNIFGVFLESITLRVSSLTSPGSVTVFNGNGIEIGSSIINASGDITIILDSDSVSSSGEAYSIVTTAQANFRISQDGILYSAGNENYESKLPEQLFLGQR